MAPYQSRDGFLAASVVKLFESTIETLVILAVLMPIVAGMGGNAATQAITVVTRGSPWASSI